MSADSNNVVKLFGYFQNKRFLKALEHLCSAYELHLAAEQKVLEAIILIGWEDKNMTSDEKDFCDLLAKRAGLLKQSGKHIRTIMRSIASYKDEEESSEEPSD